MVNESIIERKHQRADAILPHRRLAAKDVNDAAAYEL